RDHLHAVQHHAQRRVAGVEERRDHLQPLQRPDLALALAGADGLPQRLGLRLQVQVLQEYLDRLGAHPAGEVLPEPVAQLPVEQLIGDELLRIQLAEGVQHFVQPVDLPLRLVADLPHLPVAGFLDLAANVGLGALRLQLGQVRLGLGGPLLDLRVPGVLQLPLLRRDLVLDRGQVAVPRLGVHPGDHVRGEVDDLLQVLRGEVQQVAEPAGYALEVPDVGHRGGELDVAHPLPADLGAGDLHATPLADDALEADPLVLTAVAFPVPGRAEDLLAEQPILLGLQRPVVDGLRLLHLTVRPLPDTVRSSQPDPELIKEVDIEHVVVPRIPRSIWVGAQAVPAPLGWGYLDFLDAAGLPPRQVDP